MSEGSTLPPTRYVALTLGFAALAFAVALWPTRQLNVWLATGIAALVSGAAAVGTNRDHLRVLFPREARPWILGALGGVLMAAATHAALPIARMLPGFEAELQQLYVRLHAEPGPVAALPVILFVVLVEELLWRGVAFGAASTRFGAVGAILVAVVAYTVPHIASGSWVLVLLAAGCGLVWTVQRHFAGNLAAPLATHVVWDILVFVAWPVTP